MALILKMGMFAPIGLRMRLPDLWLARHLSLVQNLCPETNLNLHVHLLFRPYILIWATVTSHARSPGKVR